MRERATLFTISTVAILATLLAVQRHQQLGRQSDEFEKDRASFETRIGGLESRLLECAGGKASALEKVQQLTEARDATTVEAQTLGKEIEALKASPEASPEAIVSRIEAWQKDWTERETALQALVTALDGKVDAAIASFAEVKKEVTTPESALLTKLDQIVKLNEPAAQLPQQMAAVDGKLQALDKVVADVAALSQGLAQLQTSVQTGLQSVAQGGAGNSDELVQHLTPLSGKIAELTTTLDAQRASMTALRAEVRRLLDGGPRTAAVAGSPDSGEASAVTTTVKAATDAVVVIAAGTADGIDSGQFLYVTRDGQPVARIRVINAYDHLAGAKIIETIEGRTAQKDDSVTSVAPAGWASLESETVAESEDVAPAVSAGPPAPDPAATQTPSGLGTGRAPPPPPPPPPAPEG